MSTETLDSWKAIAVYLKRDVRTVMRWERVRALPVHRVPGGGKPGVYALKSELDAWLTSGRRHVAEARIPATPSRRPPSVAVLPFANLSADKENEHFGDGLADEIITALTRIRGLRVTARTSSFAFRDTFQDVREIGARLGVSALLEGSVQRSGGRVRVSAQLVDAGTGFHLWSDQYDRDTDDIFAVQDQIARAIALALRLRLEPSRGVRRTENIEAYNHWLKARHYQQFESLNAMEKCRSHLEGAIALDPGFAQPYVSLALLCRGISFFGALRPRDATAEGRAALKQALALDDSVAEAHAISGVYRAWTDFDWCGAGPDFDRALALAPASSEVHALRALHYLVPTGRLRDAEEEMERVVESDPVSPLAYINLGKVLLWRRQFDRARAALDAALELRPDYPPAIWYRGAALFFQGAFEEGLRFAQEAMRRLGPNPAMMGGIGMALGFLGRHAEARAMLNELAAAERNRYVSPIGAALIHLGLGEIDACFESLARAVEERDPHIFELPVKPTYDRVRNDPRFNELLRTMKLA